VRVKFDYLRKLSNTEHQLKLSSAQNFVRKMNKLKKEKEELHIHQLNEIQTFRKLKKQEIIL